MNFKKYHVSRNLFSCNIEQGTISAEGTLRSADNRVRSDDFIIMETGEYTINALSESGTLTLFLFEYMEDGTFVSRTPADWTNIPYTFSLTGKRKMKFVFAYISENITPTMVNSIMLNSGSTPLPYEPYSSEVWHDIPHYIHKTSTDTITTLPTVLYPTGTTATVGLKGKAVQSGTPTPDNPVMPQGTGERTGNLAPPLFEWVDGYVASNGLITVPSETYKEKSSDYILIDAGKAYTFSMENGFPGGKHYSWRAIGWYAQDKTFISRASGIGSVALSTAAPSNAVYCRLSYRTHGETTNPMFNLGSTAIPYEPYGYKIPISSASTTTPIYLGEVESTRRIKKLVLDGTEDWDVESQTNFYTSVIAGALKNKTVVCTHQLSASTLAQGENCFISTSGRFNFTTSAIEHTAEAFKSYLAAQYAAGTPVTVWYVLAEPETGIVNEPLMKIGEYADSISGITIPVTAGGDTISVDTTLQPSEVTVNYKGWHPVLNAHEKSKNLFDKSKRTDNSRVLYTTGEISALSGVFVSSFIPIEPNTTYTLNIVSGISGKTGHLFALYDDNKNFVDTGTHEATGVTVYTFTTPSNVAYIRFNGNMSSVDSTMFNTGSTALPYEPYWT